MLNRHKLRALAAEHNIPLTKTLKTWPKSGQLVTIEVDRPVDELADELRDLGLLK